MYAKKWKFELVLPSLTVAFGLITLGGGFVQNAGGLIGTRIILGWFEGCLFPALALFTADWYKREELAVRFAFLFGRYQSVALWHDYVADCDRCHGYIWSLWRAIGLVGYSSPDISTKSTLTDQF